MNILIVGSGAREHAMAKAFTRSSTPSTLFCYGTGNNPGIRMLCANYRRGNLCNIPEIIKAAREWNIQLSIIGPEAPLECGLVDALEEQGILCVGPRQALARIETSKSFARNLLEKYKIFASPQYKRFRDLADAETFLKALGEENYVIKADALMGGKGVKVAGDHLHSFEEALEFCRSLYRRNIPFLIEEKLIGQEFSLLCFTDGEQMVSMPPVQDHKRAYEQDKGPNTGGMGSYTDANHRLPFLEEQDIAAAERINAAVLNALKEECRSSFKGVLYGSFIATARGVFVIEYNARFGDPEALNLLALLEADFTAVCHAIASGRLSDIPVAFKKKASVCKYAVPIGYPDHPLTDIPVDISNVQNKECLYLGAIDEQDGVLKASGSRALAVIGLADALAEAEKIAEAEISRVQGELFHRKDIGTAAFLEHKKQMMAALRVREPAL